jgi:hypothetical protein
VALEKSLREIRLDAMHLQIRCDLAVFCTKTGLFTVFLSVYFLSCSFSVSLLLVL